MTNLKIIDIVMALDTPLIGTTLNNLLYQGDTHIL